MIFKYTLIHYKFLTISTWRRHIFPAIVFSKCGEIHVLDKIMCFSHFGEIHAFFTHFGEIHAFFKNTYFCEIHAFFVFLQNSVLFQNFRVFKNSPFKVHLQFPRKIPCFFKKFPVQKTIDFTNSVFFQKIPCFYKIPRFSDF